VLHHVLLIIAELVVVEDIGAIDEAVSMSEEENFQQVLLYEIMLRQELGGVVLLL